MTEAEMIKQMQRFSHIVGVEKFLEAVAQSMYSCQDGTQDLEDNRVYKRYRYVANEIHHIIEEIEGK